MRWIWRLLTLVVLVVVIRVLFAPQQPQAFIAWSQGEPWVQKMTWELQHWQRIAQDLPTSLEVEIRRLWREFKATGDGRSV